MGAGSAVCCGNCWCSVAVVPSDGAAMVVATCLSRRPLFGVVIARIRTSRWWRATATSSGTGAPSRCGKPGSQGGVEGLWAAGGAGWLLRAPGPAACGYAPRGRGHCCWRGGSWESSMSLARSMVRCRALRARSCRSGRRSARWWPAACARPRRCMTSRAGPRARPCTSCSGSPRELLNDDRLGRALESFAVYAEHVRGLLAARAIERFGVDAARLHVDLTTVRVTGAYEDSALDRQGVGRGPARGAPGAHAAGTSADGVSLYLRPDPGNAPSCVGRSVAGAAARALEAGDADGLRLGVWGSPSRCVRSSAAGLQFIVPLKANTGFRERYPHRGRTARCSDPCATWQSASAGFPRRVVPATAARYATGSWTTPRPASTRTLPCGLYPLLRGARRGRRSPASAPSRRQKRPCSRQARARRALLQNQAAKSAARRADRRQEHHGPDHGQSRDRRQAHDQLAARGGRDRAGQLDRRRLRARNQPQGRLSAERVLRLYKDQQIVERRHRDLKQTLKVRPIFLHNDDRVYALISIIGIALLIFGLIESQTTPSARAEEERQDSGAPARGKLAKPTGRNILAAFQGLGITYTTNGSTTRPPHPHTEADPRTTRNPATLARAGEDSATELRKMGLAVGGPKDFFAAGALGCRPRRFQSRSIAGWMPVVGGANGAWLTSMTVVGHRRHGAADRGAVHAIASRRLDEPTRYM